MVKAKLRVVKKFEGGEGKIEGDAGISRVVKAKLRVVKAKLRW